MIAGMVAGAGSINGMAEWGHGGMKRVFTGCAASLQRGAVSCGPLRWGHMRQLNAVARRFLMGMGRKAALLLRVPADRGRLRFRRCRRRHRGGSGASEAGLRVRAFRTPLAQHPARDGLRESHGSGLTSAGACAGSGDGAHEPCRSNTANPANIGATQGIQAWNTPGSQASCLVRPKTKPPPRSEIGLAPPEARRIEAKLVTTGGGGVLRSGSTKVGDDMQENIEVPASAAAREIVVGVDGSPQSILALKWAKKLAPTLDASIVAVAAWQLESAYGAPRRDGWDPKIIAEENVAETLAKAFGDNPPAGLRIEFYRGQPAKVLMERSKSAAMLILGSRGHGGFKGLLLGSVSTACAAHAECPVLVARAAPEPLAAADASDDASGSGINY